MGVQQVSLRALLIIPQVTRWHLLHMVRLFEDDEVTHVDDCVDPVRDLETITSELCLKDKAYKFEEAFSA